MIVSGAAGYNNAKIASLRVHADLLSSGFLSNEANAFGSQLRSLLGLEL